MVPAFVWPHSCLPADLDTWPWKLRTPRCDEYYGRQLGRGRFRSEQLGASCLAAHQREGHQREGHQRKGHQQEEHQQEETPARRNTKSKVTKERHTKENYIACYRKYQIRSVLRPKALSPESLKPLPGQQDISDDANCSVYSIGFPRTLLTHEFINQLEDHRIGKVASVHISPPTDDHPTCTGAERLMEAIRSRQIWFPGHDLRAVWNPCKAAAQDGIGSSRVVGIVGPPHLVAPSPIVKLLERHFTVNFDQVIAHLRTDALMVVEYRFVSYKDQAAIPYSLVRGAYRAAHSGVSVYYFRDPCDPETPWDDDSKCLDHLLHSRSRAAER